MNEQTKLAITALLSASVSSLVTVCVTEPVRAWFQRRRVRKWLYREIVYNCQKLAAWVHSAKSNPEMQNHTAAQFAAEYRKLAYELAVRDPGFYSLRGEEPYFIDGLYRDFDRISRGAFDSPEDCFLRAEVAAQRVFLGVQDRALSRRLVFRVSNRRQRRYLRERLPSNALYINYTDAPRWMEWVRGYLDALLYWTWRKRARLFSSRKR